MANPYPANFTDDSGTVREAGAITFTDSGNQPGGSSAVVSVLGPYTVNYNTPNLTTTFVTLDTLQADMWLIGAVVVPTQVWDAAALFEVTCDPTVTNIPLWGTVDLSGMFADTGQISNPNGGARATIGSAGTVIACDAFGATGLTSGQVKIIVLAYAT